MTLEDCGKRKTCQFVQQTDDSFNPDSYYRSVERCLVNTRTLLRRVRGWVELHRKTNPGITRIITISDYRTGTLERNHHTSADKSRLPFLPDKDEMQT